MVDPNQKVYIIDDDEAVRSSLSRLMRSVGIPSFTFSSAEEFLKLTVSDGPGCLILDVQMEGISGLELQEQLSRRQLRYPIIFLTGHGTVRMSVHAMKEGAFDFFIKPVDGDELVEAVTNALDVHAGILGRVESPFSKQLEMLTRRELEVMRCVISGALNKQIAGHLQIKEKTVKTHRGRVMHKLGIESVAELVRKSIEVGVEQINV